jgi:hypothetical protein
MYSLRNHFLTLLNRIQPKEDRVSLAIELPTKVRDYLKECDKIITVKPYTRLSGSYARDTAVKKIKDVDILLFVDPKYKDEEDSAKATIDLLVNALDGLPKALGDENGKVDAALSLKRQRRSVLVHVTIDENEFDMDIVPSVYEGDNPEPLDVPDRDLSKWISSNPLGYSQALSDLNQDQEEKIVPLIKMFKHWRDAQMKYRRPKSYWLECMVFKHAKAKKLKIDDSSYGELFHSLLVSVYEDYIGSFEKDDTVPPVKDPMLGKNVAKSWTRAEFETFMRRIDESKNWAARALETEDETKAIELWQKVFNDDGCEEYFPTKVDETLNSILARGAIFVSKTGNISGQKPVSEKVWESPKHRYFGG